MWPEREHGAFEKEVDDGLKRLYFGRYINAAFLDPRIARKGAWKMKKAKIVVVLVIVLAIGFIGWQNAGFVTDQRPFKVLTYESPEIYNGVVILAAFLLGALLVYISGLLARFKARKEIKELTAQVAACQMEKSALQKENAAAVSQPPAAQPPDAGPADPDGAA
jgi:uncharacterized integral membrane protein